jgi:hypothetical protein
MSRAEGDKSWREIDRVCPLKLLDAVPAAVKTEFDLRMKK